MPKFKARIAAADTGDLTRYDRLAAFVKRSGFDAVSCGSLAELTQDQMADPEDSWVRFTAKAAGIMKFVETDLINGVLSPSHIEKNARLLAEKSRILAKHDLYGAIHALEPQWLPESFYEEHGEIRGPRVDHPGVARHKYFSPCIDRPEVLSHYREAVRKLLELAPRLKFIGMWGNDSGAGICWCKGLYPGHNGPDYCRDIPMGKRIRKWLQAILAGGRDAGCQLEITFGTHQFGREDTYGIIRNLPAHARVSAGFGPFPNEPFIYPTSRELIRASNEAKRPAALGVDPTLSYPLGPIGEPPIVYFIYDIIGEAARSGATGPIGVGGIGVDSEGAPSVAARAVVAALSRPPKTIADVEKGVLKLAKEVAGNSFAGALAAAWRDVDTAFRIWPNNGDTNHHLYPFYSVLGDRWLVRPLVPVPERLTEDEEAYYSRHRHGSRDPEFENSFFISESVKNYHLDEFKWPLADYDSMLLYMDRAVGALAAALEGARGTDAGDALLRQHRRVAVLRAVWRTQRNVLRCGSIIEYFTGDRRSEFQPGASTWKRLFLEAIDDEKENMTELIRLISKPDSPLINTGPVESSFDLPHNLAELLEKKIALMDAHRGDIDVLFPGVGEDDFRPETYGDIDRKLEKEGK
ncbi:MAG: hypothetical protein ACYTAN_00285 [Planctomycetota bacterium]|jgi:hypothetical protein